MNKNNSTVTVTRANIKDLGNARPAWTVADGEERTANMHEAARDAMTYFYDNEGNALVVTADSYAEVIAGDADKFEVVSVHYTGSEEDDVSDAELADSVSFF
jgi:hypothetical protein